jgi:hypothetical protein
VRPTALSPVWNAAGFALGAATALLGEKAAHACTEAVETVIEEHYGDQITELDAAAETELAARITKFREEEVEHKELALLRGLPRRPAGCRRDPVGRRAHQDQRRSRRGCGPRLAEAVGNGDRQSRR